MKTRLVAIAMGCIGLAACADAANSGVVHASGPRGQLMVDAAGSAGVPASVLLAIAHVEGGLTLPEARSSRADELIPVAGALELRHGFFNSLRRGAELMDVDESALVESFRLGTLAGARVLAELGAETGAKADDIASWSDAVERISGYADEAHRREYAARVFAALRDGFVADARDGETIACDPDDAVPLTLTIAPPLLHALDTPDYPGAFWIDTPMYASWSCNTTSQKYVAGRVAAISRIAIHDTEGGWDASVSTLQNDPCKSVHYIVDADGSRIAQFVSESDTAWHVGNGPYNAMSVGIEHVGYADANQYQHNMYVASAKLVSNIAERYGLSIDRSTIIAHDEVPDGISVYADAPPCTASTADCIASGGYGGMNHHNDPGVYWDWCGYLGMMGGLCKCTDAAPLYTCVDDQTMMARCVGGTVDVVYCADTCTVQPSGSDDTCTPASQPPPPVGSGSDPSTSGTSSGSSGGTSPDNGVSMGDSDLAGHRNNILSGHTSCAFGAAGDGEGAAAIVLAAIAIASRRRRARRDANDA